MSSAHIHSNFCLRLFEAGSLLKEYVFCLPRVQINLWSLFFLQTKQSSSYTLISPFTIFPCVYIHQPKRKMVELPTQLSFQLSSPLIYIMPEYVKGFKIRFWRIYSFHWYPWHFWSPHSEIQFAAVQLLMCV